MKGSLSLKLFALIVLYLFTFIPISGSIAIALIDDADVHGSDELPGFSKGSGDPLIFRTIIVSEDDINLDDIILGFPEFDTSVSFSDPFCVSSSCSSYGDEPNTQECICESTWGTDDRMRITFTHDGQTLSRYINPDHKRPIFISLSVEQGEDNLTFQYGAKDFSCDNCNGCSGIKEIEVIADSPIATEIIDGQPDTCTLSGTFTIPFDIEGQNDLTLVIKDNLWSTPEDDEEHSFIRHISIDTDFTKPIIDNIFTATKNGKDINFLSNDEMKPVQIKTHISEKELSKISVYLSKVGNNEDIINANPSDYCTKEGMNYTCIFSNTNLDGGTETLSLPIIAEDSKGNIANTTTTKTFTLDTTSPEVISINSKTSTIHSFLREKDNTLVMELVETGSGLSNANIFLNLNALNGQGTVKADNCTQSGNSWYCYWYNVDVVGKEHGKGMRISRVGISKDDAGNSLQGIEDTDMFLDKKKPEILNLTITAVSEGEERTFYQSGDILKVKALIDLGDVSPMGEAFADFLNLYTENSSLSEGECTTKENNSLYECTWQTNPVKDGFYTADIKFNISDLAGNYIEEKKKIAVYGITSEVPDNFEVIHTEENIPPKINRMTASLIPNPPGYKILVPFRLKGGGNDIEVLKYDVYDCLAYGNSRSAYEQVFADSNNPTPNPVPMMYTLTQANEQNFLEFTLASMSGPEINDLFDFDVNCTVAIYQRSGEHIYAEPEIENLLFDIKLRDSALDTEPGEEIIKKINDSKSWVLENTQFLTSVAKIMKKLQDYCSIAQQVISVWNVFAAIESVGAGLNKEWIFQIGCIPYELMGGLIGKLYYGKPTKEGSFGIQRCGIKFNNVKVDDAGNPLLDANGNTIPDPKTGLGAGTSDEIKFNDPAKTVGEAASQWTDGEGFPGLRNICGFVSCEYSSKVAEAINKYTLGEILQNFSGINVGSEKMGSLGYISTQSPNINAQDSIIMSAATICIPGLVFNLDKYRQIQCRYIKCLKETALAGAPTYICDAKKSQSYCIAIFGEFAETVGILKLIKNMANQVTDIAADILPKGLKLLFDKVVCDQDKSKEPFKWLVPLTCDLPRAVYNTIDSWNRFKAIGKYANADSWKAEGNYPDACEEVLKDDFLKTPSTSEELT